jgi:iron complex transport system ATP-binding protein
MNKGATGGVELDVQNLSVAYGTVPVLRDISADPGTLRSGRLVAVIGPNGSGKSTLLKTLCGLLPYKGSVRLNGRELRAVPRAEMGRAVGMLHQRARVDAAYSVYDIIGLGRIPRQGLLSGFSDSDERAILGAASMMNVERILFRLASRLSGGETQRALIAMLLAQDPEIYLLDEPSSTTDLKHSITVFSLFRRLADSGKLVIAAIHDVNLAARFADSLIAVKEGRIVGVIPSNEIDGSALARLFDVQFESFSSEKGERVWHARI